MLNTFTHTIMGNIESYSLASWANAGAIISIRNNKCHKEEKHCRIYDMIYGNKHCYFCPMARDFGVCHLKHKLA